MDDTIQAELAAIRERAGFALLTDRAFLRITGPDATRWLNGMVTNSVQALAPGAGCYNFLLNAQGRIQGDCTIYRETAVGPSSFLLETSGDQVETIQKHLDRFIIMDDVELTPALEDETTLLLIGPEAPRVLTEFGLPAPGPLHMAHVNTEHGPVLLLSAHSAQVPRNELRAATATMDALLAAAQRAGATEVSAEALEAFRILEGRPKFGTDIRERDLPQETNQTHALHFNKGCYLGQEIVERIRSRGQVHRLFTQFRLEGELPTLPAPLEANGKPAGELTSAALVPLPDGPALLALGYVRREALDQRLPLTYQGGSATPWQPEQSR